jgi:hypothetical protein
MHKRLLGLHQHHQEDSIKYLLVSQCFNLQSISFVPNGSENSALGPSESEM